MGEERMDGEAVGSGLEGDHLTGGEVGREQVPDEREVALVLVVQEMDRWAGDGGGGQVPAFGIEDVKGVASGVAEEELLGMGVDMDQGDGGFDGWVGDWFGLEQG